MQHWQWSSRARGHPKPRRVQHAAWQLGRPNRQQKLHGLVRQRRSHRKPVTFTQHGCRHQQAVGAPLAWCSAGVLAEQDGSEGFSPGELVASWCACENDVPVELPQKLFDDHDGRRGLHESWRTFYCQRCRRSKDSANPKHDRRGAQDLPAKRGDCAQTPGRELAVIVDQCFISNTVNMRNPALLSSVNGLSQVQVLVLQLGLCPQ